MAASLSTVLTTMEPALLTTGWGRTEGPLGHAGGSGTRVDLAGSRLLRWDPADSAVTVVREQTGEGNGCTLDLQGCLIMCEGADHRRGRLRGGAAGQGQCAVARPADHHIGGEGDLPRHRARWPVRHVLRGGRNLSMAERSNEAVITVRDVVVGFLDLQRGVRRRESRGLR